MLAGNSPNTIPIKAEKIRLPSAIFREIDGLTFGIAFPSKAVTPDAKASPINPPKIVKTIDSIKN